MKDTSSRAVPTRQAGLLALLAAALGPAVSAQEAPAPPVPAVFTQLEGEWTGEGELLGRPGAFSMRWEIGTGGFVRLSFSNAWVRADGSRAPVLSSEATYFLKDASAVGVWLDDRPQRLLLQATWTDSTLTTEWTADAESGRTEYLVRSPEEVVVRDIVYVDGSERPFGEATYRPR